MPRYFVCTDTEAKTISVKKIDKNLFWCFSCDCTGAEIEIDYTAHFETPNNKVCLCIDCFERLKQQINNLSL